MPQGGADFGVSRGQSKKQTKPEFAIRKRRPHATKVAKVVECRSERFGPAMHTLERRPFQPFARRNRGPVCRWGNGTAPPEASGRGQPPWRLGRGRRAKPSPGGRSRSVFL